MEHTTTDVNSARFDFGTALMRLREGQAMTITTEMLERAGCKIVHRLARFRPGEIVAKDRRGYVVAVTTNKDLGWQWRDTGIYRPRFRVKAQSVPVEGR